MQPTTRAAMVRPNTQPRTADSGKGSITASHVCVSSPCQHRPTWDDRAQRLMRGAAAAFECAALFQVYLPEQRKHMRHQVGLVLVRREQDQVGEALGHHGCDL